MPIQFDVFLPSIHMLVFILALGIFIILRIFLW